MNRVLVVLAVLFMAPVVRGDEFEPEKTHAVIVGVLEWKHGLSGFSKVNRKDQELRDLLVKRGTPAENITLLLDQDATLPNIRKAIAKTLDRAPADSTLIIYYAGHGWSCGNGDYGFANYEVQTGRQETEWRLKGLGETLANHFKGKRVFLWADCCFSGGFKVVVDALAAKKIAAFNLTSAGTANVSTSNWTFTQSIIDSLRGEPLVDANGDGKITLGEMNAEVREAMKHLEGQNHGFSVSGLNDDLVMAKASGPRPKADGAKYPIGSYVQAKGRYGRIVAADGETFTVQFYAYTEKVRQQFRAADLVVSQREPRRVVVVNIQESRPDAGGKPDCEVEWKGAWYPAVVVKREKDRWYIHYVGYDKSWDEWVGKDRIRFNK